MRPTKSTSTFYLPNTKQNTRFKFNFIQNTNNDVTTKKQLHLTSVSPTKFSLTKKKNNVKYNVINMS